MATAQSSDHCPFLNRADVRCGEKFSLDQLDHAFHYCFDRYSTCAIYQELLAERQVRRISAHATDPPHRTPLIQVTVSYSPLERSPLSRAA